MDAIIIIVFAIAMRSLMNLIKKSLWAWEVIRYTGAALPVILIMSGILENDGISIIFAGICFFWFPLVQRRGQLKQA